jgi:hypothetical protein
MNQVSPPDRILVGKAASFCAHCRSLFPGLVSRHRVHPVSTLILGLDDRTFWAQRQQFRTWPNTGVYLELVKYSESLAASGNSILGVACGFGEFQCKREQFSGHSGHHISPLVKLMQIHNLQGDNPRSSSENSYPKLEHIW